MKKTAIVIGATGLVGLELVNCLATAEHIEKIVTLTRREAPHSSEKVRNHIVDFDGLRNCSELLKGDMLFSCLGTTMKQAKTIEAQRRVDFYYQLEAAIIAANQNVSHYLLVSSSGANSRSLSPYLRMKGELEDAITTLPFEHISIFQPSLLIGEREQSRVAEGLAAKFLPTLCKLPGLKRYRPIAGFEVAQKMLEQSRQPQQALQRFKLDEVFP